jgi:hypothetical protein
MATNEADPSKTASASVTVVPIIVVTVSPDNASVPSGTAQQFKAVVTGTASTSVAWSVAGTGCSGAACGTISSSGLYVAPTVVPSPATVTVRGTSSANPTKSGTVSLTILSAAKGGPVLPTLPKATVDLTMPVQAGTVRNVAAGNAAAFQSAINAATCGDTIVLAAGSTYTGNFTVPNRNCVGWVLIESSGFASLPPSGTRVSGACNGAYPATICPPPSPGTVAKMATIMSGVADHPTLAFQAAAHNWRLIGLEITQAPGLHDYALIETDNFATSAASLVSHLIIDRCYIHGTASGAVRRGVSFQVANGAIVDSDIREIHDQNASPGQGADSQAIAVWSGSGPFLYQNNFLSAASENTMFGGNDPSIAGMVPSDITIVGNHYWKDYAAWHGKGYDVKNLFELKNAQRLFVDGNVFDGDWTDAQQGTAIVFTVRNQNGGCNWCVVQDVTFTHNMVENAVTGLETTGSDDANTSLPDNRILVQNDVFTNVGTGFYLDSAGGVANRRSDNITIDHDDVFETANILISGDTGQVTTLAFTNNIGLEGSYTFGGAGTYGYPSLTFSTFVTSLTYKNIVVLTPNGSSDGKTYPSGKTYFNSTANAGFTNYSGGNYQFTGASPYRSAGSDGKDIGVWDWSTFNTETNNALGGIYPQ